MKCRSERARSGEGGGRRGSKCAIKWRWLSGGERRGSYCEQDCCYVTRDDCAVFSGRGRPFCLWPRLLVTSRWHERRTLNDLVRSAESSLQTVNHQRNRFTCPVNKSPLNRSKLNKQGCGPNKPALWQLSEPKALVRVQGGGESCCSSNLQHGLTNLRSGCLVGRVE